MRFIRATANFKQFGISPESLDIVFTDIAIATKCLNGAVSHTLRHVTTLELHTISVNAVAWCIQLHHSMESRTDNVSD